jgi:zinc transporter ZupT
LFIGIVLHHIPVAFALVSMLMASGLTKQKTLIYLGVFALMTPLGSYSSFLLSENTALNFEGMFDKIMAIVIGIFLHISTTILFESGNDHRFNLYKIVSIIVGGVFGILLTSM